MASYFWAGVQGLISVPSLPQGLGAASVGKHMLFFSLFLGLLSAGATFEMYLSQHLKRQQNTLNGKSSHRKDPVTGSRPGRAGLCTRLREMALQPRIFPAGPKKCGSLFPGSSEQKKKSAWGETSPSSPQQANVSWYFASLAPVCCVVQQHPRTRVHFPGRETADVKRTTNLRPSRESCLHWPWRNIKGRVGLNPSSPSQQHIPWNPLTLSQHLHSNWYSLEQSPARGEGDSLYSVISG